MLVERRRYTVVKSAVVLFVALVLQLSIVSDLRLLGAVGDLLVLVTVAAALADGPTGGPRSASPPACSTTWCSTRRSASRR
jgi:hypothetical protein